MYGFGGVYDALIDIFEEETVKEGVGDGFFQLVDCCVIKIFLKTKSRFISELHITIYQQQLVELLTIGPPHQLEVAAKTLLEVQHDLPCPGVPLYLPKRLE